MHDIPNVLAATNAVISVLEGRFDYSLIGGLAVILRGHDRLTQDVDAIVWDLDDRLDELAALLVEHGFHPPTSDQLHRAKSTRLLHTIWQKEELPPLRHEWVPKQASDPMKQGHRVLCGNAFKHPRLR